jgi:hypothetical protein
MRFVPVGTAEHQAALMLVGMRDRLIRHQGERACMTGLPEVGGSRGGGIQRCSHRSVDARPADPTHHR